MFRLSQRSLNSLSGVNDRLQGIVHKAITTTKVDFGVICGLRTREEQRALVDAGASQTMQSKHLSGDAVDLLAYVEGRGSWELNLYDDIAEAMRAAAISEGMGVRWGAAWTVRDIRAWKGSMGDAMMSYVDERRSQGRRPFIDAPHFELVESYFSD